jgi:hypothetical protein
MRSRLTGPRTLLALLVILAAGTSVAVTTAWAASADGSWLTTRTQATHVLPGRFKDISSVACAPDKSSATQVFGTTRYWQRFWCSGHTYDRVPFKLRFKATGQCGACWTITNLTGLSATHLLVRHASVSSTSTTSGSSSGSCGSGYYRNVDGHCVLRPTYNPPDPAGATAQCVDGTYSYSEHASGTCSHHRGVARWINHP